MTEAERDAWKATLQDMQSTIGGETTTIRRFLSTALDCTAGLPDSFEKRCITERLEDALARVEKLHSMSRPWVTEPARLT